LLSPYLGGLPTADASESPSLLTEAGAALQSLRHTMA
jgi:hypothetical protein